MFLFADVDVNDNDNGMLFGCIGISETFMRVRTDLSGCCHIKSETGTGNHFN